MRTKIFAVIAVVLLILVSGSFYVVDETQQVVVTQFGRPVGQVVKTPGIHWKVPLIQETHSFAKNLLEWDGDPGQIPTLDKTYLWVDVFARWRITDPLLFFETVNNEINGQKKLDDIIDPATRNFITSNHLIEAVRTTNRKMEFDFMADGGGADSETTESRRIMVGRELIANGIKNHAAKKLVDFGIELVDVRIKRINYVEEVLHAVYGRMTAERKQIAEKFRSEGLGESMSVSGNKERDLKRIMSEAYRRAQEIMGRADAQAARIYADALKRDPEFYSFVNTLEIYKNSMDKETQFFLSTESELYKYLKGFQVR